MNDHVVRTGRESEAIQSAAETRLWALGTIIHSGHPFRAPLSFATKRLISPTNRIGGVAPEVSSFGRLGPTPSVPERVTRVHGDATRPATCPLTLTRAPSPPCPAAALPALLASALSPVSRARTAAALPLPLINHKRPSPSPLPSSKKAERWWCSWARSGAPSTAAALRQWS